VRLARIRGRSYDQMVELTVEMTGPTPEDRRATARRPAFSVVVPVYDAASTIVDNAATIRCALEGRVGGDVEVIVVSDGSLDGTDEALFAARPSLGVRVIHYDRNLGKGYAVRAGAFAARADWIGFIDADLDLDPELLPGFLETARREQLDFAIGSKRHPDSSVHYPRSRRLASWCYQQLNRFLFRLDVRDTQVGIKVFSRRVVDEVMPLLLVKQFAFDLELLAVGHTLGFTRIRELPIKLDYRFTGSGVRSRAVARALVDTAAIFYRLRILRTYQRKRDLLGAAYAYDPTRRPPLVTLLSRDVEVAQRLDYPGIELVLDGDRAAALAGTRGELVAIVGKGMRPSGNWLTATSPLFARADVGAVVAGAMAPRAGSTAERAAAAVLESRFGVGSRLIRVSPGNIRFVDDFGSGCIVVRRSDYLDALEEAVADEELVGWLVARGRKVVFTPDTMIVVSPPPLIRPHLRAVARYASSRGYVVRRTHGRTLGPGQAFALVPFVVLLALLPLALVAQLRWLTLGLAAVYLAAVVFGAVTGGLRFRSIRVAVVAAPAFVASHVAYGAAFLLGAARGR
jgi:glycosyltransferase involved in cell wall biosynthesis